MFDGIRDEQLDMVVNYIQYIKNFREKYEADKNIRVIVFESHNHQVRMTRFALQYVNTEFILFVEADAPLTPDNMIPFEEMTEVLHNGWGHIIRLYHESVIQPSHERMFIDDEFMLYGIPLQRTMQFSARPHLALTDYYEGMLIRNFSEDYRYFIEDKMHSVCQVDPWEDNKILLYMPEGNKQRSYHLDGRGGEQKYGSML